MPEPISVRPLAGTGSARRVWTAQRDNSADVYHDGAMTLEAVTISLGAAVVKGAVGVWLGSNKIMTDMLGASVDLASQKLIGYREQRRFRRLVDESAELVAAKLEPLITVEYASVPANEQLAAALGVTETLERVALTDADLFAVDLDAGQLDRYIRRSQPDIKQRLGLSADGDYLYDALLREACSCIIQYGVALPQTGLVGLAELLRRDTELIGFVREALDRLPVRRNEGDFERDYRQLVANRLDQIEFFGATLSEASRRYPLSVAYLSLAMSSDSADGDLCAAKFRVTDVIGSNRRLFIRGEAGLGKTTLLQWIAVHSARATFDEQLGKLNDTVPFFIALRRHAIGSLPAPEEFVSELGRSIAAEMPPGWVHSKLRSGKAVVLIDGLDELSLRRREEVRTWLRDLLRVFPEARYMVTTRPSAAPTDWLGNEDFEVCELEPMNGSDVREFVTRWHSAMRQQSRDANEREALMSYEVGLIELLETRGHLRRLAGYPLLCALLCALHRDRHAHLPANRLELYEVALHMLLERRDTERGLAPVPGLTRTAKTLLLQDVAYWLIRNGLSEVPTQRMIDRLGSILPQLGLNDAEASEIYRHLLERSGLIREPVHGHTNFVHRTFQEYLAGRAAVDADDIEVLLRHATSAEWRETIVMAAGHARPTQRQELIEGLLTAGDPRGSPRETVHLLAVSCLETAPELAPVLRARVRAAAADLLPPTSITAARSLASAGVFVLDLLADIPGKTVKEVAAIIRTVAEIGDPAGLPLLERYVGDERVTVRVALRSAWSFFDVDEYLRRIIAHLPSPSLESFLPQDPRQAAAVLRVTTSSSVRLLEETLRDPNVHRGLEAATSVESVYVEAASRLGGWLLTAGRAIMDVAIGSTSLVEQAALVGDEVDITRLDRAVAFRGASVDAAAVSAHTGHLAVHSLYLARPSLLRADLFDRVGSKKMLFVGGLDGDSDLGPIVKWAKTLQVLWLSGRAYPDLAFISELSRCELLVLEGARNISSLDAPPSLKALGLIGRPPFEQAESIHSHLPTISYLLQGHEAAIAQPRLRYAPISALDARIDRVLRLPRVIDPRRGVFLSLEPFLEPK